MKRPLAIALALGLIMGTVACSPTEEPPPVAETGGVLNIAILSEAAHFDPHLTTLDLARTVHRTIYEPLLTVDANRNIVPDLAESYEVADDGLSITFVIRDGVAFHNGDPVTPSDVIASMERWQRLAASPEVIETATFTEVDATTVRMDLQFPSALAVAGLANTLQPAVIMPKSVVDAAGDEPVRDMIGTGPFVFDELVPTQYLSVVRNEAYVPRDEPSSGLGGAKNALVDQIVFHFVSDPSTQLAGVQTGEYDVVHQMTTEFYTQVNRDDSLEPLMVDFGSHTMVLNKNPESTFSDIKMREAINTGIDSLAVEVAVFGNEDLIELDSSYALVGDGIWHSTAGSQHYNINDKEKAKELLAAAGYAGEEIVIIATNENQKIYNSALALDDQLKQMGVNSVIEVYDMATMSERMNDPSNWDIYAASGGWRTIPTSFTYLNPGWKAGPMDDRITELVAQIDSAETIEDAKATWIELQGYYWEFLPFIKLGNEKIMDVISDRVEGYSYLDSPILWGVGVTTG